MTRAIKKEITKEIKNKGNQFNANVLESKITQEKIMTKKLQKNDLSLDTKNSQYLGAALLISSVLLLPELSMAADAFADILEKAKGWINGSAGKLVTFISLAMAGIMGVAGFPTRYVVGALGTGLLLASSSSLVDMIF